MAKATKKDVTEETVEEVTEEVTEETVEKPVKKPVGERKVPIYIPLDRGEDEGAVFFAVNDRTFLVRKGETVMVPECVAEVWKNKQRADREARERRKKSQK